MKECPPLHKSNISLEGKPVGENLMVNPVFEYQKFWTEKCWKITDFLIEKISFTFLKGKKIKWVNIPPKHHWTARNGAIHICYFFNFDCVFGWLREGCQKFWATYKKMLKNWPNDEHNILEIVRNMLLNFGKKD